MQHRGNGKALHLGWLGGVVFASSVLAGGANLPGFDHAKHSVGLLGSVLAPQALAFNVFGFGLSGLCIAGFALALERSLNAQDVGRIGRLATSLLLISGLAFAAQGAFAFDPGDVDGATSRKHAFTHAIALLAWLPSTALLAWALRGRRVWRPLSWLSVAFAAAMLLYQWLPAHYGLQRSDGNLGHAQRIVFLLYFFWPALVAMVALRTARPGDA